MWIVDLTPGDSNDSNINDHVDLTNTDFDSANDFPEIEILDMDGYLHFDHMKRSVCHLLNLWRSNGPLNASPTYHGGST